MRLLDHIVQAAAEDEPSRGRHLPPGVYEMAQHLRECQLRYVIGDEVARLCAELAFEEGSVLSSSVPLIRAPAPLVWLEFDIRSRHAAFAALGRAGPPPTAQRIGLLVRSDAAGQSGTADIVWESLSGNGPEAAPFVVDFDFSSEMAWLPLVEGWDVDVCDLEALQPLYDRVRFRLREEWRRYYTAWDSAPADTAVLTRAMKPVVEEVPFLAIFLLLIQSRRALRETQIDRTRINLARAKRNAPQLLDHLEVTLNLASNESGVGLGMLPRHSPRYHFVRGHLVHRGDAVFWRSPHFRGDLGTGRVSSRTVRIEFRSAR